MEPSCSGWNLEGKDESNETKLETKCDPDMLHIDQLERQDLEEENRLTGRCSGVIVDTCPLNLSHASTKFPHAPYSITQPSSSSENSSSLIFNSTDRPDSTLSASCNSTLDVIVPDNCCEDTSPVCTPAFDVKVSPPYPGRPYFIRKLFQEQESSSPKPVTKELDENTNKTVPGTISNSTKDGVNTNCKGGEYLDSPSCKVFASHKAEEPSQKANWKITTDMPNSHLEIQYLDSVEGVEENIAFNCESESEHDITETEKDDYESRLWRKRKEYSPSRSNLSKKLCNDVNSDSEPQVQNNPPEIKSWLSRFSSWSGSERLRAIDLLIKQCAADQVRHMMETIKPLFQRDFISFLPKELALAVLGFVEPDDLLRAAQTCKYWRFLADDNLLWKEKCARIGIVSLGRRIRSIPSAASPWKTAYMRQRIMESNWQHKPISSKKCLKGHDDHVITCLQFYGNKILSGSDDTTLKVWSAVSGRCLKTLVGHTGGVWSSQMIGRTVISGSTDRTLKVWDVNTGACLRTLTGHTSTVRCMHLCNDKVVSGSRDASLRVWSVLDGRCLHVLNGHEAAVRCVQYDGRYVISGAYDHNVKVWNPETGECLHTLTGHSNRVYSLQFDGVHVVSGSLDTSIMVWDVETGAQKHTLMGHQSLTSGMELRSNILVSGNADSTVKIWDIITGQCLHTLSGPNKHQSAVTCLQSNSRFVITSSDDGTVKLWDLRTGQFIRNLVTLESGGSGGVVWRIRASHTKLVCAVGSRNGTEETKLMLLNFDVPETEYLPEV